MLIVLFFCPVMPAVFFVCLSKVVFIGIVVFVDEAGTKFLGRFAFLW